MEVLDVMLAKATILASRVGKVKTYTFYFFYLEQFELQCFVDWRNKRNKVKYVLTSSMHYKSKRINLLVKGKMDIDVFRYQAQ